MDTIKVAIYEDNNPLRGLLATIIRESDGFELAGEFDHALDVIPNTLAYAPDVIIMDIDMPGKTGIEAVKEVKQVHPDVEIIMHTVFDDDDRIFNAIKAGATGYLLKNKGLTTLLDSIRQVYEGGSPISPAIARRILISNTNETKKLPNDHALSQKEIQILELLAQGLSYKMVGDKLDIKLDTVRTYIKRIYEKLHVHSVTEAIHKVYIDKN